MWAESNDLKIVNTGETQRYYRNFDGIWQLHREDDLPAIVYTDGHQAWYWKGQAHRENDLPAVKFANGDQLWCFHGQYHRANGQPAYVYADGHQEWWVNGQLHRIDGPAILYENGTQLWYRNGQLHRLNGPAIKQVDGYQAWYLNGQLHRENGPAVERVDGTKSWYWKRQLYRENGSTSDKLKAVLDNHFKAEGNFHDYVSRKLPMISDVKFIVAICANPSTCENGMNFINCLMCQFRSQMPQFDLAETDCSDYHIYLEIFFKEANVDTNLVCEMLKQISTKCGVTNPTYKVRRKLVKKRESSCTREISKKIKV